MKCILRSLSVILFSIIVHLAYSTSTILSSVQEQIQIAVEFLEKGDMLQATQHVDRIKLFDQQVSSHRKTTLGNQISQSFLEAEKYTEAKKYADQVLEFALMNLCSDDLELAESYLNAGVIYYNLDKFVVSENYLFKAKEILSAENGFYIDRHISTLLFSLRRYSESLAYIEAAERALDATIKSQISNEDLFEFYAELITAHVVNGNKSVALKYADNALSTSSMLPSSFLVRSYVSFAGIYMNYSERDQCKLYLDKARPIILKDSIRNNSYHYYRGMLDYGNQSYVQAIENFQLAIDIRNDFKSDLNFTWMAFAYALNNQVEKSIETLDVLMTHYLENDQSHTVKINETYRDYANIYSHVGQHDKAIAYLKKGFEELKDENDLKIYTNTLLIETYANQVKDSFDIAIVDTIFNLMERGQELIVDWRIQSRFDKESVHTYLPTIKHYSKSLAVLTKLDTIINHDNRYLEFAFKFIDGMKAHSYKQEIQKKAATKFSNLPESIVAEETRLSESIREIELQLHITKEINEKDIGLLKLEEELEQLKNSYTQFLNTLEINWPNYFMHKYATNETDVQSLQETLEADEAIIEYYIDRKVIYIFAIESNNVHYLQTVKPTDFNINLEQFIHSISDKQCLKDKYKDVALDIFVDSSSELYDALLKEVLSRLDPKIKYLNIIPENELNYIPFEILLRSHNEESNTSYKELDYLLNDFVISIQSSAAIYLNKKQMKRSESKPKYVGFAPTYENGLRNIVDSLGDIVEEKNALYADLAMRGDLNDLPMARRSVSEIAELLDGRAYIGDQATKETFIEDKSGKLIHLAMHGIANDDQPSYSQLIFSENSENKHLYVSDVINLDLSSVELAVLSACNTGIGELHYGEGVLSISYAFSVAGCSSMVMSLWSVPDVQTSELDKLFFGELYDNERIDDALRNSKLSYLENASSRTSHPFYWAGLIVSGKTEPVFKERSYISNFWN